VNTYIVSLAAGVLVGVVYGVLNVRSPAPPVVALVGLLGILLGEQVVPAGKRLLMGEAVDSAWIKTACVPHVLGSLPGGETRQLETPDGGDAMGSTNRSEG
jgi:XapX domain-containing protein